LISVHSKALDKLNWFLYYDI